MEYVPRVSAVRCDEETLLISLTSNVDYSSKSKSDDESDEMLIDDVVCHTTASSKHEIQPNKSRRFGLLRVYPLRPPCETLIAIK